MSHDTGGVLKTTTTQASSVSRQPHTPPCFSQLIFWWALFVSTTKIIIIIRSLGSGVMSLPTDQKVLGSNPGSAMIFRQSKKLLNDIHRLGVYVIVICLCTELFGGDPCTVMIKGLRRPANCAHAPIQDPELLPSLQKIGFRSILARYLKSKKNLCSHVNKNKHSSAFCFLSRNSLCTYSYIMLLYGKSGIYFYIYLYMKYNIYN